jgi:thiosulfate dehydrogenase [quinone] large subunit
MIMSVIMNTHHVKGSQGYIMTNPPVARFLFEDRRFASVWLIVRILLGWVWVSAGIAKLGNPAWMQTGSALIAISETLIGVALILGLFVGIAAFAGSFMNCSFIMTGTDSSNGPLFVAAILLILAWKTAGYYGLDRFVLPRLGLSWRSEGQADQHLTPLQSAVKNA